MSLLTYATAQLFRAIPRARVGRALGRLADHRWSPPVGRAVVGLYSRLYDVDLDDCEQKSNWQCFDAFFTRALRQGTRPLDPDPWAVLCPADGRLDSLARIDETSTLVVKGRPYFVHELIGSRTEAARYAGGWASVVYLSPRDYHRVHSPVRGKIHEVTSLPGDYYPVNAVGLEHVPNLFARNRRVVIAIDTEAQGRVCIVMVAAMIVGRITVTGIDARDVPLGHHVLSSPLVVDRGAELGVFHLGSTAVLLAERRAISRWLVEEGPTRLGRGIASGAEEAGVEKGAGATRGGAAHAVLVSEANGQRRTLGEVG